MPGLSIATEPARSWRISSRRALLRGGATATMAQGARIMLQMAAMAWMAHHTSPGDFGLVAIATGLVALGQVLAESGIAMTLVQRADLDNETLTGLVVFALVWACVLAVALGFIAPLAASFYRLARLGPVLWLAAVIIPLNCGARLSNALMQRDGQWLRIELVAVAALVIGSLAGAGVVLNTHDGVAGLLAQGVGIAAANCILGFVARPWRPRWPQRWRMLAAPLSMTWHLALFGLIDYGVRQSDDMLVGWRWGAAALGSYGRAHALVGMATQLATGPATALMLSALSRARATPGQWHTTMRATLAMVLTLAALAQALLLVLAPVVVDRLLGLRWHGTEGIVRALTMSIVPGATVACLNAGLASAGQTRRLLAWKLASAPLWLGAFALALPWGPVWVARAFVGVSVVLATAMATGGHGLPRGAVLWRAGLAMAAGCVPVIGLLPSHFTG